MKSTNDGFNYILRLEKGELLVEALTNFIRNGGIKGGWVMGLGGLAWAELGFYELQSKQYNWRKLDQPLELTSLTGNIAWDAELPVLHLHSNVSDADMQAYGGHLKEAEVAGTVELFIHILHKRKQLTRANDPETGLNLLRL